MGRRDAGEGRLDGYSAADRARQVAEPPKRSARGDFARDRARVLHSSGLRRLGAKTQVVTPGDDDFARTRLTHSLEVAQVGRGLADALGCDPDVVDTACLAHDLGHPPFGHNGESVLAEVAAGTGGFEGNAQTLRLLSRLEPKVVDAEGRAAGLNLTRASLDAATKYPWGAGEDPRGATGKFGVYHHDPADAAVFAWLREGAPPARRCLEAQVMDLADDVAYSVHDVEDAVVAHRLDLGDLADLAHRAHVAAAVTAHLPDAAEDEVGEALDALAASTGWVTGFDGSRAALAGLKDLTSQLIGRFCGAVENATREAVGPGRLTRYAADLVVPRSTLVEITALKAVASVFVMTADDRVPVYERQRQVLGELVASLVQHPERLEPPFAADHAEAADDGARLRVVVDQVASLTDVSALAWWARSTGAVA